MRGSGRFNYIATAELHKLADTRRDDCVLLAVAETHSVVQALAYLAIFGIGSIVGMVSLSVAISMPARLSLRHFGRVRAGLEAVLGSATIALGCWITLRVLAPR